VLNLRRWIYLTLLGYTLGLIPFYFLTSVHQSISNVLGTRQLVATGTPDRPVLGQPSLAISPTVEPGRATGDVATVTVEPTDSPLSASSSPTTASSAAKWLLFAAKGDLWETNGERTKQLTHNGHLSQPSLVDDALVYVERQKNYSDLWFVQAGAAPRRLTHGASPDVSANHWVAQPVLLPDSRGIDVLSDQNKDTTGVGDLAIWQLDLATESLRQMTHPPPYTGGDQDVAIDPHEPGTIVFTRYIYAANGQLIEQLTWLEAGSDQTVALTTPDHPARQASFAPDGTGLAFVQTDGQVDGLYVGRLETDPPRLLDVQQVATGTNAQPVWSPDGNALAYVALTNHQFDLWVRSISRGTNGTFTLGAPHQLTKGQEVDPESRPVWLTDAIAADLPHWLPAAH
jgi:hypothetical protein